MANVNLNETLSPLSRGERNKVNENWERLQRSVNNLQNQMNMLAGGDLGDLAQEIQDAIDQLNSEIDQGQLLIDELDAALINAQEMESLINNFESLDYSPIVEYDFPNFVKYNGSTYIALQRVEGLTPNDDGTNWRLAAAKGTDGAGAVINNLTSTDTTNSLSANQGRILDQNKVNNSDKANTAQAIAGTDDTKWMTPRRVNDVTGTISMLETDIKDSLVDAVNEVNEVAQKVTQDLIYNNEDLVGYGVVNGLLPEPQTWPIRDMTIQVSGGVVYMPDGQRFEIERTPVINIASSPTMMRKDAVYVDVDGTVKLQQGTPSTGESDEPLLPIGTVLLGIVTVKAGATVIDTLVVKDSRKMLLSNLAITEELQVTRESNAQSIRHGDGIITKLLNNAQTFVKHTSDFNYGTPTALASGPIYTDGDGKFLMNCSSFGQFVTKGLTFYNSKYGGMPENIYDINFCVDLPATDDMFTYDWAIWAYNNGFGFTPNADLSNLIAGDAIFFSWSNVAEQLPKHYATFMNLDHTSIFIKDNPDGTFMVYEDGLRPALYTYPASYRSQIKYACRVPFNDIPVDMKNIIRNGGQQIVSEGRTIVNTYTLNESLQQHKWYTAVIKGDIQTAGCWFNVYNGSTLLYSGRMHGIEDNDLYTFKFCTRGLDVSSNNITINLVADSESSVPSAERDCVVEWFVLTPVFTDAITEYIPGQNAITFAFNAGYSGSSNIYYNGDTAILNVRVNSANLIADNALVDIGTITNLGLVNNRNLPAQGMVSLTVAPSYSRDVTAWVQSDASGSGARLRLVNGTAANRNFIDISVELPIKK